VPTVTGKVYSHSKRIKEKRAVLEGVAAELRRIIGAPAKVKLSLSARAPQVDGRYPYGSPSPVVNCRENG
jgi:hypothetical protein